MYRVVLSRQAVKDRDRIVQAGLGKRVKALLELISEDPYRTPPPYEKLVGRFELYGLLQDGLQDVREGKTRPFSEAIADIRAKRHR